MAITSAEANAIRMLTLDEARTRKLTAEAELAEIELAKAKGDLVPTEMVIKAWIDVLSAMKAKLLAIPSKAAPVLAAEDNPGEVQKLLDSELEEALNELSNYQPTIDATTTGSIGEPADQSDVEFEAPAETQRKRVGRPRKKAGQPK